MAYASPDHIAVGAIVTHTQLQKYSDSLEALLGNAGAIDKPTTTLTSVESRFSISGSGQVTLRWYNSAGGTDQKRIDLLATTASQFYLRTVNDAYSVGRAMMLVERTSYQVDRVYLRTRDGNGGSAVFALSSFTTGTASITGSVVSRGAVIWYVVRRVTAGQTSTGTATLSSGATTADIYSDGGANILRVAYSGSALSVSRVAGTDTYHVSLFATYI